MKRLIGLFLGLVALPAFAAPPVPRPLLVLPFENLTARSDLDWLSEGIAEILSTRLAGPDRYVLSWEDRDAAYQQLDLPPGTALTLASQYEVAATLGVDQAVVGNFKLSGSQLMIHAQMLDVHGLKLSAPLEVSGKLVELAQLGTDLAWRLLALYDPHFTVGAEQDFSQRFPPLRLDAFENYIRGILASDEQSKVRFLTEAARLDPSDHRAAFELGRLYFGKKDYAPSAAWFEKLVPSDSEYRASRFFLGVDELFLDHNEKARGIFSALAQQVPLGEVSNNLGVTEAREDHYRGALASFLRAYQGDPTDADFSFNTAVCYWYLKDYRNAAQYLESALRARGDDAEAHTLFAAVLEKLDDSPGEQRELQWLSQHEGEEGVQLVQGYMPQTRLKKHYDGRAFQLLAMVVQNAVEQRLEQEPPAEHGRADLKMGESDLEGGRWADAERELNEAASLIPGDSEVHLALGRLYAARGKAKEAAAELETSLNLKESVAAHLSLARVYLSMDLPKAAHDQSEAALRLDPSNREAKQILERISSRAVTRDPTQ